MEAGGIWHASAAGPFVAVAMRRDGNDRRSHVDCRFASHPVQRHRSPQMGQRDAPRRRGSVGGRSECQLMGASCSKTSVISLTECPAHKLLGAMATGFYAQNICDVFILF